MIRLPIFDCQLPILCLARLYFEWRSTVKNPKLAIGNRKSAICALTTDD